MNLDLTNARRLADREEVMRSYPVPFQLEFAVCLGVLLGFAAYLLSVTL
jgi:hypothetical protein